MRTFTFVLLILALVVACESSREEVVSPAVRTLLWDFQNAYERSQYTRALALLDSAVLYAPQYARLHYLRGDVLSTLYRFDEADASFARVQEIDPRYPSAAYRRGNNAFFVGQTRQALGHYYREQKVVGRPADVSAVWAQIGRTYARLGVADSARTAYEKAIAADGTNDQVWEWLAELSEDAGQLDSALRRIQEAIKLDPDRPSYQYLAGALQYRMGDFDSALVHLEAVIAAEPWHPGAHYNLGRSLMALGRTEEAAVHLAATDRLQALQADIVLAKFAARQNPQGQSEWSVLGMLYEEAGQFEEARHAHRIARQLQVSN